MPRIYVMSRQQKQKITLFLKLIMSLYLAQRKDSYQHHCWEFMGSPLTHSTPSVLSWQGIFLENLALMHAVFLHAHPPHVAQSSILSLCTSFNLSHIMSTCTSTQGWWLCSPPLPHEHSCDSHCVLTSLDSFQALRPRNTFSALHNYHQWEMLTFQQEEIWVNRAEDNWGNTLAREVKEMWVGSNRGKFQ